MHRCRIITNSMPNTLFEIIQYITDILFIRNTNSKNAILYVNVLVFRMKYNSFFYYKWYMSLWNQLQCEIIPIRLYANYFLHFSRMYVSFQTTFSIISDLLNNFKIHNSMVMMLIFSYQNCSNTIIQRNHKFLIK